MPLSEDLEKLKNDPNLVAGMIARIAPRIRDHEHLTNKLSTVPLEWKQIVYDILKPNLRFQAWPLHRYMSAAADRAVREMLPTIQQWDGLHAEATARVQSQQAEGTIESEWSLNPQKEVYFSREIADAESAIADGLATTVLLLVCGKCTERAEFRGVGDETPVAVMMKARRAGWIYDNTGDTPREICPTCPTSLRKETIQ
jgi:hypothetical protein